ncbi:MAG TPA: hypothetical protein VK889_09310 [Solirubrobacterales bacterium]|nr:hypothetical protein [Solirubrobacterales bacterium]
MNENERIERRVERAVFETDRQILVGDVTLPPAGYQSRFSDSLNRGDLEFVPLTNVEITSLIDGRVSERSFVVLSKRHVRLAYPYPRQPAGPGMAPPPGPGQQLA